MGTGWHVDTWRIDPWLSVQFSGRSRISQKDTNPWIAENLLFGKIFAKNCMKMKIIGLRRGDRPWQTLEWDVAGGTSRIRRRGVWTSWRGVPINNFAKVFKKLHEIEYILARSALCTICTVRTSLRINARMFYLRTSSSGDWADLLFDVRKWVWDALILFWIHG